MNRKYNDYPKGKVFVLTKRIALSLEFQQVMTNFFFRIISVVTEQSPGVYIWRDTISNRDISEDLFRIHISISNSLIFYEYRHFTGDK